MNIFFEHIFLLVGISNAFCRSVREDIDLTYQVNLRSPCQAQPRRQPRHARIHVSRLPDIVAIAETVQTEVKVIRDSYILNRFDSENILEKLRNSTWPRKLYGDMSKPDEFCGQIEDVLLLLWQATLNYTTFVNYIKKDELIWSGFSYGIRRRAVTFELSLTLLEMNHVSNLLCAVKLHAEAHNVELEESFISDLISKQNQPIRRKTMAKGDRIGFQILNAMTEDFLPFVEEYFTSCDI